jgi:transcriptional regulator with XRE-family HTH domain
MKLRPIALYSLTTRQIFGMIAYQDSISIIKKGCDEMTGEELKKARTEAGFSIRQLANSARVDPRTISRIESGESQASPAVARKLEGVLKAFNSAMDATIQAALSTAENAAIATTRAFVGPQAIVESINTTYLGAMQSWMAALKPVLDWEALMPKLDWEALMPKLDWEALMPKLGVEVLMTSRLTDQIMGAGNAIADSHRSESVAPGLVMQNQRVSADVSDRVATLEARLKRYEELPTSEGGSNDVLLHWIVQSIREDTETELGRLKQGQPRNLTRSRVL